jgi:hypothetical protein
MNPKVRIGMWVVVVLVMFTFDKVFMKFLWIDDGVNRVGCRDARCG